MQERHIRAQSKSERAASSPGVVPVGPCMCFLSFLSRRRRPVTAACTHVLLHRFVSDRTLATPSYRPYRLATMPVTLQMILSALWQNLPSLLNTSWDKGAELLGRTINVLFGIMTRRFALPSRCRGDVKAADKKCRAVDKMVPLIMGI
jgi:hypothetical protein